MVILTKEVLKHVQQEVLLFKEVHLHLTEVLTQHLTEVQLLREAQHSQLQVGAHRPVAAQLDPAAEVLVPAAVEDQVVVEGN